MTRRGGAQGVRSWFHGYIGLTLAVTVLILYGPAIGASFLSDDFNLVTILTPSYDAVAWNRVWLEFVSPLRCETCAAFYRPLLLLSGALDFLIWGLNPAGYHLTNLLLALLNVWLTSRLASRLTGSERAGLLAGLLMAVYPYHPKDVWWGIGRNGLLVGTFILGSLLAYVRVLQAPAHASRWAGPLSLGCLVLALLTKETAVAIPLAMGLLWSLWRQPSDQTAQASAAHRGLTYLLLSMAILVGYAVLRWVFFGTLFGRYGQTGIEINDPAALPRGLLLLWLWSLTPVGGLAAVPVVGPLLWLLGATAAVLAGYFLFVGRKDRAAAGFAILTIVLALPILTVIATTVSPAAYMRVQYVPSIGVCLLMAQQIDSVLTTRSHRAVALSLFLVYGALFTANSLPWMGASRVARAVLAEIERTAAEPGTERIVVDLPDGFYGAELFGPGAWALPTAARAPYINKPTSVDVVHRAGVQDVVPAPGTVLLRWDPDRWEILREGGVNGAVSVIPVCTLPLVRCPTSAPDPAKTGVERPDS